MTYPVGPPAPYGYAGGWYGPPGRIRSTGISMLLFVCTFSIYMYVYNFQVHSEMKEHSGRGVGGGVALLLTFLANIAMPFVTPNEVGNLYTRRGEQPPVTGLIGLWVVVPWISSYVVALITVAAMFAWGFDGSSDISATGIAAIITGAAVFGAIAIGGGVVWFVKTNGALNRYWESVGVLP